ncbi:MAG: SAM-dependent methyltransferase [Ferruginibacter sp.]
MSNNLPDIIIQQIKQDGPISFHDFMEHSLYHPGLGYYNCEKEQIGKNGDFFTSSSLTPAFGAMIGKQIQQMWDICGEKVFTIVEYGAGTGLLCYDILNYFKNFSNYYDHLNYYIIEKSPVMIERQKKLLKEKVSWFNAAKEFGEITGCILSNELLDNFAVHRVVMQNELMEIFVDYKDNFVEVLRPAGESLTQYLAELGVRLPAGFKTEINLEAIEWLIEIASFLKKGYILTIDYGSVSAEIYGPRKSEGSLRCFTKHTINHDLYSDIGNQDITSHVNFSALCHYGLKHGIANNGLTDQAHFLLALGFKEWLRKTLSSEPDIIAMARKESFLTNLLLVEMGNKFKVLIQRKGLPEHSLLGTTHTDPRLQDTCKAL